MATKCILERSSTASEEEFKPKAPDAKPWYAPAEKLQKIEYSQENLSSYNLRIADKQIVLYAKKTLKYNEFLLYSEFFQFDL